MIVKGTYFQNSEKKPLVYDDVEIINPKRRQLRGEKEKDGIIAETVIAGFCGTDLELMKMSENNRITAKFPEGQNRLINGHEGVVWIPSENRFAIVLIRGGNSYDPTRFEADETYFEYGCDNADGLMCERNFYNPDMLLNIPEKYIENGKISLSMAKKLIFSDPYACMLFQYERMSDLGVAHLFRLEMARHKCQEEEARKHALNSIFDRVVIFGLGTTGMFIGDIIRQNNPNSKIVLVGRSSETSFKARFAVEKINALYTRGGVCSNEELSDRIKQKLGGQASVFIGVSGSTIEHKIAFEQGVLGNNGIYNSFSLGPKVTFDTMPFGFKNHLIFGSINFRRDHMKKAIEYLCESDYEKMVEIMDFNEFINDPVSAYKNKIFSASSPVKTAVIWNDKYIK